MQTKFTKFFQLVYTFPSCLFVLVEKFRESKSRSLYYHRTISRIIFRRESWLAEKNYKTLQNFFSLFPTFSRILERRAPNTCCPKIPPTSSIRKSHKMYTHISSLSLCWHKSLSRKWDKDLIIRIKPSSLLPLLNFQQQIKFSFQNPKKYYQFLYNLLLIKNVTTTIFKEKY